MNVVYYEGECIYFRPIEMDDGPLLQQWINDPRNWSTLGHRGPINGRYEQQWIERVHSGGDHYNFGVVVKDADRLIGTCGFDAIRWIDRKALVGIVIGDVEMQNQGHGSEAMALLLRFGFEELNLNRIELCVFSHNPRAIRVYEKLGFVREGCHRQAYFRHGRYHDELRYGILREAWEAGGHGVTAEAALPDGGGP